MTRIPHCRRCGARDAEAPDGYARFASQTLFGPIVARDLCARCFSIEMWIKWRFLTTVGGLVVAGHFAWTGDWPSVVGAVVFSGVWWSVSTIFIEARSADDADAP